MKVRGNGGCPQKPQEKPLQGTARPLAGRGASQSQSQTGHEPRIWWVNRYYLPDHAATAQVLGDLTQALATDPERWRVVTSRQRYDDPNAALPASEVIGQVRVHRLPGTRLGRRWLLLRAIDYLSFYLVASWFLCWRLRRDDVVVCKTDPPLLGLVLWPVIRLRRARIVHWLQDLFPEALRALGLDDRKRPWCWLAQARNASLRAADAVVAIGREMARRLASVEVPRQRITVIGNWPMVARAPDPERVAAMRARLGLEGRFVVCHAGNLGRAHEIDTLLGAARRLRDVSAIRFLVSGGGVLHESLRVRAADEALTNLCFSGYVDDAELPELLAAADLHLVILRPELEGAIVPSKFYGICQVGRPVLFVGSPEGELARLVQEHGLGGVIDCGDADGLAAAIAALHGDPLRREAMGVEARGFANGPGSRTRAQEAWRSVLASLDVPVCRRDFETLGGAAR